MASTLPTEPRTHPSPGALYKGKNRALTPVRDSPSKLVTPKIPPPNTCGVKSQPKDVEVGKDLDPPVSCQSSPLGASVWLDPLRFQTTTTPHELLPCVIGAEVADSSQEQDGCFPPSFGPASQPPLAWGGPPTLAPIVTKPTSSRSLSTPCSHLTAALLGLLCPAIANPDIWCSFLFLNKL